MKELTNEDVVLKILMDINRDMLVDVAYPIYVKMRSLDGFGRMSYDELKDAVEREYEAYKDK